MELLKKNITNDVLMHQVFFSSIPSKWICKSVEDELNNHVIQKDPIQEIIKKEIPAKLLPLEYIQYVIDIGDDDNIIKQMLCDFISEPLVSKHFTKKGCSMILEGITTNKWNIYLCRFYSFLFDTSFIYRKQCIAEHKPSVPDKEPYIV